MEHIQFDTIPGGIRVPGQYLEFNTRTAVQGLPQNPQKVLLLAPMLASGTQPPLTPVQLFSDVQAGDLFGRGSWAQLMVRQAFYNNAYLDLTVIGLPDPASAVAASGKVVLSGTASGSGQLEIVIGGTAYAVSVAAGDTAAALAGKLKNVITAADSCPVTAAAAQATLTLTAKNKGAIGNEISLSASGSAPGLSITTAAMASGAGSPDLTAALAVVAGKHYHIVVSPFTDDTSARALGKHIEDVSNSIEQRGCIGVFGWRGTLATGTAFAAKLNSGRLTCAWYKGAQEANALIAAGYAAVLAFEEDPARPLNTLEVKGLNITPDGDWPLYVACHNALYNGLTPLTVVNNRVQIMRAVSTYTRSAAGVEDPSLLDITTIRTLDYVRRAIKERIALRFARNKLFDRMVPKVKSEVLDVLTKLEDAEIIENVAEHKHKLLMVRAVNDTGRLNAAIPADVVNGLHVFAGRIDLIL